jgi:16S rRNA (guanine1207-N2)-methyltransferase
VTVGDQQVVLVSKPGVFAWDRLDGGTVALIATMQIGERDRVLDLGCGSGLAGLIAAQRATSGSVTMVDADIRAVESSRRTLVANGVRNAEAMASDCAAAVSDRKFTVVITNPPFHQGVGVDFDVAYQFVVDAARVLEPRGRLFLVANRHLRYADVIHKSFGNSTTVYADNHFHVLSAVKW